jgi:PleD family two-component response regulator
MTSERGLGILIMDLSWFPLLNGNLIHPITSGSQMTTNLKIDGHSSNRGDSNRLEDEHVVLDERGSIIAMPPSAVPAILIIDDDQRVLDVLANALATENCRLTASSSGADGLELACRQKFDLILLDLGLPDLAGFALKGAEGKDNETHSGDCFDGLGNLLTK